MTFRLSLLKWMLVNRFFLGSFLFFTVLFFYATVGVRNAKKKARFIGSERITKKATKHYNLIRSIPLFIL